MITPQAACIPCEPEVAELVPGYLANRRRDVSLLIRLVEHDTLESWAQIETIAHRVAGTAASYGMPQLGEIAREIEKRARASDFTGARLFVISFEREVSFLSA